MPNPSGDTASPEQQRVWRQMGIMMDILWPLAAAFWLVARVGLCWQSAGVLGGTYLVILFCRTSSLYPLDYVFNQLIKRGSGLPKLTLTIAAVMTVAVIVASLSLTSVFWGVLASCTLVGIPVCNNTLFRFD